MLGKFEFRPTDTNIVKRYEEVVEYYNSYQLPENPSEADMRKAEDDITERISYLIGRRCKKRHSFLSSEHSHHWRMEELYMENVLSSIAKVIEKEMNIRTNKVQSRMNKYVARYHN